jgi:hypothetical protein
MHHLKGSYPTFLASREKLQRIAIPSNHKNKRWDECCRADKKTVF